MYVSFDKGQDCEHQAWGGSIQTSRLGKIRIGRGARNKYRDESGVGVLLGGGGSVGEVRVLAEKECQSTGRKAGAISLRRMQIRTFHTYTCLHKSKKPGLSNKLLPDMHLDGNTNLNLFLTFFYLNKQTNKTPHTWKHLFHASLQVGLI